MMTLREWLRAKPYDGINGRKLSQSVELTDDGEEYDALNLWEDGELLTGFTGTESNNRRLADEWCARGQNKGSAT